MAGLPSNTFMFNYNAKQYDSITKTFPKAKGQLFDEDLVLNKAPNSYTDEYVYFGNTQAYMSKTYSSTELNPFNRSSSLGNSFTFIYKTSAFTGNMTNIFANRDNSRYNWMVRGNIFHTSSVGTQMNPPTDPQIYIIRINSDGSWTRQFVDAELNVLASLSGSSISWGNITTGFGIFGGSTNGGEFFSHYFYWMYCSRETLTDEEVLKVIKYNEGDMIPFGPDEEELDFYHTSSSATIELTSENPWTATVNDSWITLSDYSGETGGTITVTVAFNSSKLDRIGTVDFTDGENSATLTVNQKGYNTIILSNLYRNGNQIKVAFKNGEKIYQMFERGQ